MLTKTILTAALFFIPPPEVDGAAGELCVPLTPEQAPSDVEIFQFDGERPDGVTYWGVSAIYPLSTGDVGEANFLVDSDGVGEAFLAINGEIVSHTSIEYREVGGPTLVSWHPAELNYSADLIAELSQGATIDMINGMVPQPIKCSDFGKKATKATKWLFKAAKYATAAACCTLSGGVGCVVCAAGTLLAGDVVEDGLDNHCD